VGMLNFSMEGKQICTSETQTNYDTIFKS